MDLRVFLAHAVKLEFEAEEAYLKLVELMTAKGNQDAAAFFREMAEFSKLHRKTAMQRAGFDDSTDIRAIVDSWPGGLTETPRMKDPKAAIDLDEAISIAREAENRGVTFYEGVSQLTTDPQIRALAEEFAQEERGHVRGLERFAGQRPY